MWGDECVCWLDRGNLFMIHTIQKYNKQFLCEVIYVNYIVNED